jgi:putative glycosyltransferase (TIGR04348 family)
MNIHLVTPAKKNSKNGNRTSALRWAKLLREGGHKVRIATDYNGESTDLVIALHAWRSAAAIDRYRVRYPLGPLIVALGGTDVNTNLRTDSNTTLGSMHKADTLVCLHDLIADELPAVLRKKLHVIYQSAIPLPQARAPGSRYFDVCVIGHLRKEKDPFRSALAARLVPPTSKLRIRHFGKAHSPQWSAHAQQEMNENPRYQWLGEVPKWRVRQEFVRTRAMVISSNQEGGANVVSEALVAGVPIIASEISGNIGLLGADYPGYYPLGNEQALAQILFRIETDPKFLVTLEKHCKKLAPKFRSKFESAAWAKLVEAVTQRSS